MKKLLTLLFLVGFSSLYSQTLVQTFIDRCTGETKIYTVQMGGQSTVVFYNRARTFTSSQFQSGELQAWLEETYLWWSTLNPCSTAVTGAVTTQQQTQQTTQAATQAAAAAQTPVVPPAPVQTTSPPPTQTATTGTTANTGTTNTATNDTSTQNTTGDTSSSSGSTTGDTSSGSDTGSSGSGEGTTSNDSGGTSEGGSSDGGSTETETKTEETKTEETKTEETKSEEKTEEVKEEKTEETKEETKEEEKKEETKEEEKKEEEKSEEKEEESKEEEKSDEEKEKEKEKEEKKKKEEEKKKKKEKRQLAPPIVTANLMTQQSPLGSYDVAATFGVSQSSLMGDKTFGVSLMAYSSGQQFMLNTNYSQVHINKEGRVSRVYSASLGGAKMFTTVMGMMNHSMVFLGKKGSAAGFALGTSITSLDFIIKDNMLLSNGNILSQSVTGFYTKPIPLSRVSITPMVAVSSPFVSYDIFQNQITWNKDLMFIGGSSFTYKLTQRFGLNIGATAITSTIKDFPVLMSYMIGGRLSF